MSPGRMVLPVQSTMVAPVGFEFEVGEMDSMRPERRVMSTCSRAGAPVPSMRVALRRIVGCWARAAAVDKARVRVACRMRFDIAAPEYSVIANHEFWM